MKKLEETIDSNLRVLGDPEDDDAIETARNIVCPFYKSGGNPDCQGCNKDDEKVDACKETYIERIKIRPMEVWEPAFDGIEVREKKPLDLTAAMGLRCDMCNLSHACPEFKARATCSVDWSPRTDTSDNKQMINQLIELQQARINFAQANELMDGGQPDQTLSVEMDRMSGLIAARADLNTSKFNINISGKTSGEKKPGILSQVFGGALPTQNVLAEETNTIPITGTTENASFEEIKPQRQLDASKVEFLEEKSFRQKQAEKKQKEAAKPKKEPSVRKSR
jgi:hypothetical protein